MSVLNLSSGTPPPSRLLKKLPPGLGNRPLPMRFTRMVLQLTWRKNVKVQPLRSSLSIPFMVPGLVVPMLLISRVLPLPLMLRLPPCWLGAIFWAINLAERHPSSTPQFTFCFDCLLAGHSAAGRWTPHEHVELQSLVRSLCHWFCARFGKHSLTWRHVKSHTGHPWNEAADAVSWAAVAGWIPTQSLHDRLPDLMLTSQFPDDHQWLWLLEDALHGRAGTPLLDSRGFHFRLDAPFDCEPSPQQRPLILRQQCDAPQRPRVRSTFDLQCATANVLTLQSKGLGARAEHLAAQFTNAGLHCTGLQETRSYMSQVIHSWRTFTFSQPQRLEVWAESNFGLPSGGIQIKGRL